VGQTVSPPAVAARCDACGHMWVAPEDARAREPDGPPDACPKCGGSVRHVGTPTSAVRYFRCETCNYLVVQPPGRQ